MPQIREVFERPYSFQALGLAAPLPRVGAHRRPGAAPIRARSRPFDA